MIKAEAINSSGLMLDPKCTYFWNRSEMHIELLRYSQEKAGKTTCFVYHLHRPTFQADLLNKSKRRINKPKWGRETRV